MDHPMDRPLEKSFILRHRIFIVTVAAVIVAMGLAWFVRSSLLVNSVRLDRKLVSIGAVSRGTLHDFMPLRVAVVPRDIVYVDASDGGRVDRVLVSPGDMVSSGQPLAALSNTQLELQVLEQEGRLIESITQLQNYQTSLEQSRLSNDLQLIDIDYNIVRLTRSAARRSNLVSKGAEPLELRDQVQDELESYQKKRPMQAESNQKQTALREKQLPQIRAQITTLQQDLKITRSKLSNLVVRAPYAGRVTSIDLKLGQTLHPGERLAQITLDTGFKLTQEVDEFYLSRLHNKQKGIIEAKDKSWPVHVSRLYPQIKNGTFTVDFEFDGKAPSDLLPGETVRGKLSLGDDTETLFMPVGPYLERTGGNWIFVLSPNEKTAVRRAIKVGRRNSEQVEVLSGLAAGDRILISDYTGLEKVDRVDLVEQ